MHLEFYRLYDQIDEHHYEQTFYTLGTPTKPFKKIVEEAKELHLLSISEKEEKSQWEAIKANLRMHGYHEVTHEETAYVNDDNGDYIRSALKPIPRKREDGSFVFVESEVFRKVNEIRVKHGKNPLSPADVERLNRQENEEASETKAVPPLQEIDPAQMMSPYREDVYTNKEERFSMDDFDELLRVITKETEE